MLHLATLASLAMLSTTAHAVRHPETTRLGAEPVIVRVPNAQAQAMWAQQARWLAFTSAEGAGWQARFDAATGVPLGMWGAGIDIGARGSEAQIQAAAVRFVADHAALLGVEGAALSVRASGHDPLRDARWIDVDVRYNGLAIWRGGVTLRLLHGDLVMVGANTFPDAPVVGALSISAADAHRAAVQQGYAPSAAHRDPAAEAVLLPRVVAGKRELRVVWHTTSRTDAPLGLWESFVDASTGELLAVYNGVRFFDGQLGAEYDTRIGDGSLTTGPLMNAAVVGANGGSTFTDATGAFSLDDPGPFTVSLTGPRVRVRDDLGDVSPTVPADPFVLLNAAAFEDRQSPLTVFTYVQQAQDFGAALDPSNPWPAERATANVNIDDVCNAYFDGTVNFFRSGGGCNNTGRLADVIFHEWGHGFHAFGIVAGTYDGSLGEGAADVYAFLMTDDHRLAPNFFLGGEDPLRDALNRQRFPEDFVNNEAYIHYNGMIFSGSMWDTREALRASIGEPQASLVTGQILARLLKAGPTIETAYEEAVFADDDDADLANGTPHQCEIVEGFGKHGLGPAGGQDVKAQHEPLVTTAAAADVDVALSLVNPAPTCFDLRPTAGTLHWRVNNGLWQTTDVAVQGLDVSASIPPGDLGDLVEYWVEIEDATGGRIFEPAGGEIRPHTFYVGDVLEVRCDDFEETDGGFTHELVAGEEGEGADDWQWGRPQGVGGDPRRAAGGAKVWGTDLGGDNFNGQYQNEKQTRLISPVYDTRHYEGVFLSYRRWLTIEDGVFDQARITADDETVWRNYQTTLDDGSAHHLDGAWAAHAVDLGGAGDDGKLQLAWELKTDQGLTFGGWTLDDVCVYAPATPNNRLGISDLVAHDDDGPVRLTWTNPIHGPVTEVVVVRGKSDWPTGHTDGAVVWSSTDITPGAPMDIEIPRGMASGFFAVYASDGTDWLSWTREGQNATAIDRNGDGVPDTGCGCATPARPSWLPALALAGLLLRRRR
jgi:MYXO-CTERM domain-containing protein